MAPVAQLDRGNHGRFGGMTVRQARQETDIARQCAAGKGPARRQIGRRPDARFRFQAALHFLGIRTDMLANGRYFVNKSHTGRKKGIQRMFGHFRRFDRHPLDAGAKRLQQFLHLGPIRKRAQAHHHAIRLGENGDGLAQPEIFGRATEGHGDTRARGGKGRLEFAHAAHRQLRRDKHQCAGRHMREQSPHLVEHAGNIRAVLGIHRRIVGNPEDVGPPQGVGRISRKA